MSGLSEANEVQVHPFLSRTLQSLDRLALSRLEKAVSEQESALLGLYQNIDFLLPNLQKKVIQFVSSRRGEGTSTTAREFGWIAANRLNKAVLILDANHRNSGQPLFSEAVPGYGWEEMLRYDGGIDKIYQINDSNLHICPVSPDATLTRHVFDSPKILDLWKKLKERFDFIIIDSPPIADSADGVAIARNVDGVILVLEAEKTRWPVAKRAKETIEKNGGNILGIVFNKRRYYIPDFIYRRL